MSRPAPQLAPRAEHLDDDSYHAYVRAERVKANEAAYRRSLIKTSLILLTVGGLSILSFIWFNHR